MRIDRLSEGVHSVYRNKADEIGVESGGAKERATRMAPQKKTALFADQNLSEIEVVDGNGLYAHIETIISELMRVVDQYRDINAIAIRVDGTDVFVEHQKNNLKELVKRLEPLEASMDDYLRSGGFPCESEVTTVLDFIKWDGLASILQHLDGEGVEPKSIRFSKDFIPAEKEIMGHHDYRFSEADHEYGDTDTEVWRNNRPLSKAVIIDLQTS